LIFLGIIWSTLVGKRILLWRIKYGWVDGILNLMMKKILFRQSTKIRNGSKRKRTTRANKSEYIYLVPSFKYQFEFFFRFLLHQVLKKLINLVSVHRIIRRRLVKNVKLVLTNDQTCTYLSFVVLTVIIINRNLKYIFLLFHSFWILV
jgi:hypothetical protein